MQRERWELSGFWFGGRYWPPMAGGADDLEGEPVATGSPDDAAGPPTDLEGRLAALTRAAQEGAAALEAERLAHGETRLRGLDHYRRALIAEHGATAVHELIQGTTEEALDASVEVARAVFARIQEQLQVPAAGAITVPAGAGARTGQDLEGMSPVQKIARGLNK